MHGDTPYPEPTRTSENQGLIRDYSNPWVKYTKGYLSPRRVRMPSYMGHVNQSLKGKGKRASPLKERKEKKGSFEGVFEKMLFFFSISFWA